MGTQIKELEERSKKAESDEERKRLELETKHTKRSREYLATIIQKRTERLDS